MDPTLASIVVPATHESLDTVRRVLLAMLPPAIDEDTRVRLGICLAEGFNNAVEHAYGKTGGETGGRIEVGIAIGPGEIVLDVADAGLTMGNEAKLRLAVARIPDPADLPLRELPERGLGFGILRSVLDEVGYTSRNGFNILRMVKRLDPVQPPR